MVLGIIGALMGSSRDLTLAGMKWRTYFLKEAASATNEFSVIEKSTA